MKPSSILTVRDQEIMASLIAGIGLIWAVQIWTCNYWGFRALEFTGGPLDLCTFAVLLWLTAKWRAVHESKIPRSLQRNSVSSS